MWGSLIPREFPKVWDPNILIAQYFPLQVAWFSNVNCPFLNCLKMKKSQRCSKSEQLTCKLSLECEHAQPLSISPRWLDASQQHSLWWESLHHVEVWSSQWWWSPLRTQYLEATQEPQAHLKNNTFLYQMECHYNSIKCIYFASPVKLGDMRMDSTVIIIRQ